MIEYLYLQLEEEYPQPIPPKEEDQKEECGYYEEQITKETE